MASNGTLRVLIVPYASLCVFMRPCRFLWALMGPYMPLCVFMDSNGPYGYL